MFAGKDHIINTTFETRSSLPLNFAITKICVVIRLAKDVTKTGGMYFRLSPSIPGQLKHFS